jgi:hypothetical protein
MSWTSASGHNGGTWLTEFGNTGDTADYMLPRTSTLRFGVREEPSEVPTVSLLG